MYYFQWKTHKDKFSQQSGIIINAIQAHVNDLGLNASSMPDPAVSENLFKSLSSSFDEELGGFGGAPKFPQPGTVKQTSIVQTITWLPQLIK